MEALHARGLDAGSAGVYFGQLLGMADNLSFVLGGNGYRVRTPKKWPDALRMHGRDVYTKFLPPCDSACRLTVPIVLKGARAWCHAVL